MLMFNLFHFFIVSGLYYFVYKRIAYEHFQDANINYCFCFNM